MAFKFPKQIVSTLN